MTDLTGMTATHLVYVPFTLLIGAVVGFILGRRVGFGEGRADAMGRDDDGPQGRR